MQSSPSTTVHRDSTDGICRVSSGRLIAFPTLALVLEKTAWRSMRHNFDEFRMASRRTDRELSFAEIELFAPYRT
jgi:hypothetical protein